MKQLLWFWIPLLTFPILYFLMSACIGVFIATQQYPAIVFPILFFAVTIRHLSFVMIVAWGLLKARFQ